MRPAPLVQERLELYVKKVKAAGNEKELSVSSRTLTVDVAAANRFIDAVVPVRRSAARPAEVRRWCPAS